MNFKIFMKQMRAPIITIVNCIVKNQETGINKQNTKYRKIGMLLIMHKKCIKVKLLPIKLKTVKPLEKRFHFEIFINKKLLSPLLNSIRIF